MPEPKVSESLTAEPILTPPPVRASVPSSDRGRGKQSGSLANKIILGLIGVLSVTAISIGAYILLRENPVISQAQQPAAPVPPPNSGSHDLLPGPESTTAPIEGAGASRAGETSGVPATAEMRIAADANAPGSTSAAASSPDGQPSPEKFPETPDVPSDALPPQESAQLVEDKALALATFHKADSLWIQLTEAKVDYVELKSLIGDATSQSTEKYLICKIQVRNTDEKKIVTFNDAGIGPNHFSMRDDVDNIIRGVSTGVSNQIVGAISSGYDIQPGEEATVIKVFKVPPPKTEYVILSVDLAAFSKQGGARFKIEAKDIRDSTISQ
ncbi:MAG: hypothetical protein U0929_01725 [Planctomycetaceae bacterium]